MHVFFYQIQLLFNKTGPPSKKEREQKAPGFIKCTLLSHDVQINGEGGLSSQKNLK